MTATEKITFQGYVYRRYPESKHKHHRRYFGRSGKFLHRAVWEHYNGEIPEGYDIHHIDGNTTNNHIDNLECITKKAHRKRHWEEASDTFKKKQRSILQKARPLAAKWHSSKEGKRWHRDHGAKSMKTRADSTKTCCWCGTVFTTKKPSQKTCCPECSTQQATYARNTRHSHICEQCGGEFTSATKRSRFCGKSCATRFKNLNPSTVA